MIQKLCAWLLHLAGWTLAIEQPQIRHYVLIGFPHTSNWDFILAMLAKGALRFKFHWVAKHTLFKGPMGVVMRAMGGIPVDRRKSSGFTEQLCERFAQEEELVVVITPEGTRSRTPHWKSGFYHLARQAKVPVALGYADFKHKRLGIGPLIELTGDITADMDRIRAFYADKTALYPELAGPIRLRVEYEPKADAGAPEPTSSS
ncbi:lysophospholipid acyltransferase family protein [Motiliproteus sp. SC1-56]|uniref:lysophospholipid acyltransferase family protein n=1 Tax=Motiliproteus sp. SC1-56 TaxID=2799565 RepID=UPI001A8CDDAF|nr:lysophospholipid acyltransferase family protein [Motiliproteus sp. SC1-56]